MNQTRKEYLIKSTYGTLQREPEFKKYLDEFIYNKSLLMNEEVEYILNRSYEDSDAPFSYDDIPLFYYEESDLINAIIEDIKNYLEEDEQQDLFKEVNEEHNLKIKTLGDYEVYLNSLYLEDLKIILEDERSLNLCDYEQQREIYQWFIMDDRILNQIEERGGVVLNDKFWGRESYGQAIELDGLIIDIFKEWFLNLHWVEQEFKLNEEYLNEVEE